MRELEPAVYVSSGAFKARLTSGIVAQCVAGGGPGLELSSGIAWSPDVLDPIRAERSIRYLIHNYFPPHQESFTLNLAATDTAILTKSRDHCRRAIDLSRELGGRFFSVHAGFGFAPRPDELGRELTGLPRSSAELAHQIFVASLVDLCAYAADRGVQLAVENNVVAPFNVALGRDGLLLCATADDMVRTYADVGSANFGFLIDVGHLKVTATVLGFDKHDFIDQVGPYITAFHLSENDGHADQNLVFGGDAWFLPRLAEFPKATMILEAYRLEAPEIRVCNELVDRARTRLIGT